MKRILTLILGACMFASCSDTLKIDADQTGTANFNIDNNYDISIASKAEEALDDSYTITILSGKGAPVFKGKYSELASGLELVAGMYSITAENCTAEQAHEAPLGKLRIAGTKAFTVKAKETVTVAFTCAVTNIKVSVQYTDNFKATFKECTVEVYQASDPERVLSFDRNATLDTPCAFYNAPAAPQTTTLEIVMSAIRNDGVERRLIQTVEVKAAEWHKLRFDVGSNMGEGTFQINFDNTITEMINNHSIDPY